MTEGVKARENPRESQTPAWTGFYCFSGYITLRMVLIYYAQVVAVGDYLLQITKERMLLVISKRRMLQIKGKSG